MEQIAFPIAAFLEFREFDDAISGRSLDRAIGIKFDHGGRGEGEGPKERRSGWLAARGY